MKTIKRVGAVAAFLATVSGTVGRGLRPLICTRPPIRSSVAAPLLYKNCTNLNKRFPHGLGRSGARDRTSDTPVTKFKRSTKLYNVAMSFNRGLDRDKDGIACEKA